MVKKYKEFLYEKLNTGLVFKIDEEDEDYTNITVSKNGKKVGELCMLELMDSYSYEFDDVLTEDEFDELFPDDYIIKIDSLKVEDGFKGEGIASSLMEYGLNYMVNEGYTQFFLNASPMGFTGLKLNHLVNLYSKFGFKEILDQGNNMLMSKIV
jgi:GNAT superfamily N-acetyltransferase